MTPSSTKEYNETNPWRNGGRLRKMYWMEGLTVTEIANEFNITHQAVLYWFDKHDIPTRSNGSGVRQQVFCANCNELFSTIMSRVGRSRFCSRECAFEGYRKRNYRQTRGTCAECGRVFTGYPDRKYCSHDCYVDAVDEGRQTLNSRYRKREKQTGWHERVLEMDNHTCQECFERGGDLRVHHIVPVADIVSGTDSADEATNHPLFADVANGLTVCRSCHKQMHMGDGAKQGDSR